MPIRATPDQRAPYDALARRDEPTESNAPTATRAQRRDIQAIRAFAVGTVVLYHAWPSLAPGGFTGVDVFFVVSGFLITSHLLEHPPAGTRDFARFWSNRALRLLPALSIVILAVIATTWLFSPVTAWDQVARDSIAATLYVENWNLIAVGSDYLGHGSAPSPLQHFWSLSVEEQYYLVWPLLICAVAWLMRRRRSALRAGYAAAVLAVLITSFSLGLWQTYQRPEVAYLATDARVWQLAAGSLLAVLASRQPGTSHRPVRFTPTARRTAWWVGAALLVASLALIDSETPYPGVAAILPTLGTVLLIAAADPDPGLVNPRPVLYARPVQRIGDISYALYLWHWPLLILPTVFLARELGTLEKVAAVLVAFLAADLSTRLIENPIRRSCLRQRPSRSLLLGAALMAIVVVAALLLRADAQSRVADSQVAVEHAMDDDCLGAGALVPGRDCPLDPPLVTTPEFAKTDQSEAIQPDCLSWVPLLEVRTCHGGDPNGRLRVALYGNSHAGQWFPAIDQIGAQQGWQVETYIVGLCKPTAQPVTYVEGIGTWSAQQLSTECARFQSSLLPSIAAAAYDVIMMSSQDYEQLTAAADYADTFATLSASGARLVVIRDTPGPMSGQDQADCLAAHPTGSTACDGTLQDWQSADPFAAAAAKAGFPVVEMTDLICADDECRAVVGGVIVIGDYSHLTRTYALTLAPMLESRLLDALS